MAKTTGQKDKVYVEAGEGIRSRRIVSVPFIMAEDRAAIDVDSHLLADCIRNETGATARKKPIFIAPCKGRILKVSVNAKTWPVNAAGTYSVDIQKAVIGASDVSVLNSVIEVDNLTDETASHGTLSTTSGAINFIEGQEIYVQIDLSNNAVTARSESALCTIEWRPTEK